MAAEEIRKFGGHWTGYLGRIEKKVACAKFYVDTL